MRYPTENYGRRKLLIVTADDFGLTRRVNDAIEKAHREGIVTTASLMVTGGAFESAAGILRENSGLDAGLHLNLTEGKPAAPPAQISTLADSAGFLYRHPFELMSGLMRRRVNLADLEREIRAQIERAMSAKIAVSHIDGHKHVHVLPQVFRLLCAVAPEYGIHAVVDKDDLVGTPNIHHRFNDARVQGNNVVLLVIQRYDDGIGDLSCGFHNPSNLCN